MIKRLLNAIAERRRKSQEIVEEAKYTHDLEQCIFIGGSLAGQRHWVRDEPGKGSLKATQSGDVYTRQTHYGFGRKHILYVHDSISTGQLYDVLLESYCNKEATGDETR